MSAIGTSKGINVSTNPGIPILLRKFSSSAPLNMYYVVRLILPLGSMNKTLYTLACKYFFTVFLY